MIKTKEEMLEYLKGKSFDAKTLALICATFDSAKRYAQSIIDSSSCTYKYDRSSIKSLDKYLELVKVAITDMIRDASVVLATSVGLKVDEVDLSQITIRVTITEKDSLTAEVIYPVWTKVFQDISIVIGETPNMDCLKSDKKTIIECKDSSMMDTKDINLLAQEAMTNPLKFINPFIDNSDDDDDIEPFVSFMSKGTPTIN